MSDFEKKLIQNAQNGNLVSLEKLLKKYSPYIKKIAMSICSSYPSLADDVHSDTLVSVFKNISKFKNNSKFSTWFYRIASNHCYMKYRQIQKEKKIFLDDISNLPSNDKRDETYIDFYKALAEMPLIYRNPIVMVDIEGMTLKQAAKTLNISLGTLKSRLFRGRRLFKENLSKYEKI
ncbi:MAG: RNA polymerase sigma factor [Elusimicrobiales bacterium]|nr:RNA polymerase sigma factor [Elusimicrobiales bacterium]